MRQWVEKLAKTSKERGYLMRYGMYIVDSLEWYLSTREDGSKYLCIADEITKRQSVINIQDDEFDALKDLKPGMNEHSKDHIISLIENFN